MGTLNQYAARIANMVNQPNNHELKERVKDMIKTMFANRIRQSVEKNGIDDILKLTFIAPVEELKYSDILPTEYRVANKIRLLGTKYKVPTPVRIQSDAPFAFVGDTVGNGYMYESSITSLKLRQSGRPTCSPTGSTQVKTNKISIESSSKFITFYITSFPTKRINFDNISILTSCTTKITNF